VRRDEKKEFGMFVNCVLCTCYINVKDINSIIMRMRGM